MKKGILTLIMLLLVTTTTWAQQQNGAKHNKKKFSLEEFRTSQRDFITKHAELTQEEAALFFPLYFELQDKKWEINHEARKKTDIKQGKECSNEEYTQYIHEFAAAKVKIAELEKEYVDKYLKVLPAKKILATQHANERFQKEMLKRMRERGGRRANRR